MEVYALSGPSGTGKSTVALKLAYEKKIPAIVDDGLLIVNGNKAAGFSAKFEKNSFKAVKRATFLDEQHRQDVQEAIRNHFLGKILIIGTSDKMVRLIAKNLELGEIKHIFHIEDVRSSSEIQIAQFIRRTEGKHVIPIPYIQIEQNFFKRLIQKGKDILSLKNERIGEITIVHPDFHKGTIKIDKNVYRDIVCYICFQYKEIKDCKSVHLHMNGLPSIYVTLMLKTPINYNIKDLMLQVQNDIHINFKNLFGIEIQTIHLYIQ